MIARLEFAAALAYSPRGSAPESIKSRRYCYALKRADPNLLRKVGAHLVSQVSKGHFPGFFGRDVTLVPMPGSAPLKTSDSLWVTERLCRVLVEANLAGQIWPVLVRETAVQKSASAGPGMRPEMATHIQSMRCRDFIAPTERILLVDDVVTKGRTLLAGANVLASSLAGLDIKAFAMIRTMGLVADVERLVDPVVGSIQWDGDTHREP
ncbi:MAG: hypothetical protein AB7G76_12900 [Steroidobacteraceae bacterium]